MTDTSTCTAQKPAGHVREPMFGDRGWPAGMLGDHETGPYAGCAIGYCPMCGSNARRTCIVRGLFDCRHCCYQWYDSRVGKQMRAFDDYFSGGES